LCVFFLRNLFQHQTHPHTPPFSYNKLDWRPIWWMINDDNDDNDIRHPFQVHLSHASWLGRIKSLREQSW
jgi:hypothetical protein